MINLTPSINAGAYLTKLAQQSSKKQEDLLQIFQNALSNRSDCAILVSGEAARLEDSNEPLSLTILFSSQKDDNLIALFKDQFNITTKCLDNLDFSPNIDEAFMMGSTDVCKKYKEEIFRQIQSDKGTEYIESFKESLIPSLNQLAINDFHGEFNEIIRDILRYTVFEQINKKLMTYEQFVCRPRAVLCQLQLLDCNKCIIQTTIDVYARSLLKQDAECLFDMGIVVKSFAKKMCPFFSYKRSSLSQITSE